MFKFSETKWIHAELSSRCQAMCPDCPRNDFGFKNRSDYPQVDLSFEQWKKLFDNTDLPNLEDLLFNGNFGDPLFNNDIIDIIDYSAKKWQPLKIFISTNGGLRNEKWWSEFGKKYKFESWDQPLRVEINFCIDGLEDTSELYRINVPYEKAMANARAFIGAGGFAVWQMIPFQHNEHQIQTAKNLSESFGFKNFRLNDCDRDNMWVFIDENNGYYIRPTSDKNKEFPRKPLSFTKDFDYNKYVNHVYNNLNKEWENWDKAIKCYAKDNKTFYIASNGEVYPCCWSGHYPKQFTGKISTFDFIKSIGDLNNNALDIGLEKAFETLNQVEKTFSSKKMCSNKNDIQKGNTPSVCVDCSILNLNKTFIKRNIIEK
jgi:MoaA/NifB/PqqE/SkfB family radical SAM enzyme